MPYPTLNDIPPPSGKTGWPWTETVAQLPTAMPNGQLWPKLSIITPSYNQGEYIEETIRSILWQGYPNLEYIIVDGGSTDNTVSIIKKYEPFLTRWVSEADRGQADAINKGLHQATGDIVAWLNSDDVYPEGTFVTVAQTMSDHPEVDVLYGNCYFVDEHSRRIKSDFFGQPFNLKSFLFQNYIPQPSTFLRLASLSDVALIDEHYQFCMDYEFWWRLAFADKTFQYCPELWSAYRLHETSKTVSRAWVQWSERVRFLETLYSQPGDVKGLRPYQNKILGQTHWRAAWSFWQVDQPDKALDHARTGFQLTPDYVVDRAYILFIMGHMPEEMPQLSKIEAYCQAMSNIIPSKLRRKAWRRIQARHHGLLAVFRQDVTKQALVKHAWRAGFLDPKWFRRGEILELIIANLIGTTATKHLLHQKSRLRYFR